MSLLELPPTRTYEPLTGAWEKVRLDPRQAAYLCSSARINYVHSGRRSFKTQAAKLRLIRACIAPQEYNDCRYFATAPTHSQSKDIFWEDLKKLTPDWAFQQDRLRSVSESELSIRFWNGAKLKVAGLDRPERIEGKFWDGGVISEAPSVKPEAFTDHISPMLLRGGWIDIEGVPEGRNHFYLAVEEARKRTHDPDYKGVYAVHHWPTWDVLWLFLGKERAKQELAIMQSTMDDLTYRQEAGGEFVSYAGRAYYNFDINEHVRPTKYDPNRPLVLCFDFNVDPGTCIYLQELPGPGSGFGTVVTSVLGEVYIPRSSNTPTVCRKIAADWKGKHKGEVHLYGDPAGGQRHTSYEHGNDWTIIEDMLGGTFGRENVQLKVPRSAPRQRARVNSLNSRLKTKDGTKHMVVSPKAKHTIEDLDLVAVKEGSAGELDESDGKYGHLTAALGYYTYERHAREAIEDTEGSAQFGY